MTDLRNLRAIGPFPVEIWPTPPNLADDTVHDRVLEGLYTQLTKQGDGLTLDESSVAIVYCATELPPDVADQDFLASAQRGAVDRNEPVWWVEFRGRVVPGVMLDEWANRVQRHIA